MGVSTCRPEEPDVEVRVHLPRQSVENQVRILPWRDRKIGEEKKITAWRPGWEKGKRRRALGIDSQSAAAVSSHLS